MNFCAHGLIFVLLANLKFEFCQLKSSDCCADIVYYCSVGHMSNSAVTRYHLIMTTVSVVRGKIWDNMTISSYHVCDVLTDLYTGQL